MIKACSVLLSLCVCGRAADPDAAGGPKPFLASDLPVRKLDFYETFDEKTGGLFTSGKWVKSSLPRYKNQPAMVRKAINAAPGFEQDKGLQLTQEMKHYGLGTKLKEPFCPGHGDAVFQYEVKLDSFTCGGAYLKFLRHSEGLDLTQLGDDTPFSVMFGPDKCGQDSKVHFIMQHQSPVTGEWEEKHFINPPRAMSDKHTHLYTLAVHGADKSFEIFIDRERIAKGSLLTDMEPAINPPREVDDPHDQKPGDWVDQPKIQDPDAVKPDDWDESQPMMLPDTSAQVPAGWREDWPTAVPDPKAERPEGWDDEEDGEWEAPTVPNLDCEAVPGCGPWTPPVVRNPEFKGKWIPPIIDNPAYEGEWAPRKIPNPDYFEDSDPILAPVGAVAVEVWTTNAGYHFDNIVVAHSLDDAWEFAAASFKKKQVSEYQKEREDEAVRQAELERQKIRDGGIGALVEVYVNKFVSYIENNRHLNSVFDRCLKFAMRMGLVDFLLQSGYLKAEYMTMVERNATSIIIGFTLIVLLIVLFVVCACILPSSTSKEELLDDEEEELLAELSRAVGSTSSSGEADAKSEGSDAEQTGLRQRKTQKSPSNDGKKKSKKDN